MRTADYKLLSWVSAGEPCACALTSVSTVVANGLYAFTVAASWIERSVKWSIDDFDGRVVKVPPRRSICHHGTINDHLPRFARARVGELWRRAHTHMHTHTCTLAKTNTRTRTHAR